MSLYTCSPSTDFNPVKKTDGLLIAESTDALLLSIISHTSKEEVTKRLANDNKAFVAWINNIPAAFGWMARDQAVIGELNHGFILPEGSRYLWNFRTLEAFRGQGIYPALLQFILQEGDKEATRFWIIHAPENKASLKGIRKAGFEYVGKLYTRADGHATIESGEAATSFREELEYMDIKISADTSASCWNCSSPYLKKRSPECCCKATGEQCVVGIGVDIVY
jgi:RimJ/RimL family protein N-acetyltransferase